MHSHEVEGKKPTKHLIVFPYVVTLLQGVCQEGLQHYCEKQQWEACTVGFCPKPDLFFVELCCTLCKISLKKYFVGVCRNIEPFYQSNKTWPLSRNPKFQMVKGHPQKSQASLWGPQWPSGLACLASNHGLSPLCVGLTPPSGKCWEPVPIWPWLLNGT